MVFKNRHEDAHISEGYVVRGQTEACGFTFIEVVLGIVILSALATPILMNQYQLLNRLMPLSSQLETIFSLKSFWHEEQLAGIKEGKDAKKQVEKKEIKYQYEVKAISEKSSLKDFKNVQTIRLQADWTFAGGPLQETLVTFAYKPTNTAEKQP